MHAPEDRTEIEKLFAVLTSFPPERQEALAAHYRAEAEYLLEVEGRLDNLPPEQAARLRGMLQEGMDSGLAHDIDFEAIKRRGRERLRAERKP